MIAKFSRSLRSLLSTTIDPSADKNSGWLTKLVLGKPVFLVSGVITFLLLGVRQFGVLEPLELAAFDRMVRLQPDAGSDSRLLVVAITEADIQALKQWPLFDRTVSQVLVKIQQYQPKVIGLDLYRDLPQPPGNQSLLEQLQALC